MLIYTYIDKEVLKIKQITIKDIKTIGDISTVFYGVGGVLYCIDLPSKTNLVELIKILNLEVVNNE